MSFSEKIARNENFSLIRQSIVNQISTDDERLLELYRITTDKNLPPMDFLFRVNGKQCFPRRELIVVTGKAKSGKTLFNSMLMASCACDGVLEIQHPSDEVDGAWICKPIKCLWYDTEQSEQSTQDILKNRVLRMVKESATCTELQDLPSYYDVFNVRNIRQDERLRLFEQAVRKSQPDLVVLDGVRDLLSDINDAIRAQEMVEYLMKMAQESDCCLVCVLHQNKGAEDRNPRGWIGTELLNKAFEIYSCEKTKPENVFVVEQTHTRKYDWDHLMCFRMDDQTELPVTCAPPTRYMAMRGEQQQSDRPLMNREYLTFDEKGKPHPKTQELFYDLLKTGPMFYTDMQKKGQAMLNCGSGMWNMMFKEMRETGYIINAKNEDGKSVWRLPAAAD